MGFFFLFLSHEGCRGPRVSHEARRKVVRVLDLWGTPILDLAAEYLSLHGRKGENVFEFPTISSYITSAPS